MKNTLILVAVLMLGNLAHGQQTTTTVTASDGTQFTATCMVGSLAANCDVRETTPSTWVGLHGRKAMLEQKNFCKAQGVRAFNKGVGGFTPECDGVWATHQYCSAASTEDKKKAGCQ